MLVNKARFALVINNEERRSHYVSKAFLGNWYGLVKLVDEVGISKIAVD
jgi:hypothetical protein